MSLLATPRRYSSRKMSRPNMNKMVKRIAGEIYEMIEARRPTEFERARAQKALTDLCKIILEIKGDV